MDFRSTHPNRASHHQTRQTQYPCLRGNHERIPKRSEKAIAEPLFRMARPTPISESVFGAVGFPAVSRRQHRNQTASRPASCRPSYRRHYRRPTAGLPVSNARPQPGSGRPGVRTSSSSGSTTIPVSAHGSPPTDRRHDRRQYWVAAGQFTLCPPLT